jgi:hypothetical protein
MTHPDAETLIQSYAVNLHVIKLQTDGLSHEDSLLQPPVRGNCLNWVLGHIIAGRNTALELLGTSPIWDDDQKSRYDSGSDPIQSGKDALPLEQLLAGLDRTQEQLASALGKLSPDGLDAVIMARGREQPLGQALAGLHWHETYHLGQLEFLRQLAGTNDAII